jgi:Na+-driven multidrug efflux pump
VGDSDVVLLDVFVWSMPRNMAYQVVTVLLFLRSTNWRKRKNRKKNRFYFNFQEHT